MYYKCNRRHENVKDVKKEESEVNQDTSEGKYIRMKTKRQTKYHSRDDFTDYDDKEVRIYENPGKI